MLWNVHGLASGLCILGTETAQHDILMLTKTWMLPDMQAHKLPGYTCFSSSRKFLHACAWRGSSGGVACSMMQSQVGLSCGGSFHPVLFCGSGERRDLCRVLVTTTCKLALYTFPTEAHRYHCMKPSRVLRHPMSCFSKTLQIYLQAIIWPHGPMWLAMFMPAQGLPLAPAPITSVMFWTSPYSLICSHVTL